MRVLFWILVSACLIAAFLAVGLLVERASGEAGIVFVLFLPVSFVSIILGFGAVTVRGLRGTSLTAFERRIGSVLGVLVLIGIFALGVALVYD